MLLEFRLRNYRSFREEGALSLVASSDKDYLNTNTAPTGIKSIPRVVRSAVVYGANASGKSNLLRGLQMLRGVVLESAALQPDQLFNIQPFRLDATTREQPTLLEITMLLNGVRYQYGFELTTNRITAEWLLVYEKAKPQRWFERRLIDGKDTFDFGPHLLGPKKIWQDATRPNALFLSTAVQLNSEQLKPLYKWIGESLIVFLDGGLIPFDYSTNAIQSPDGQKAITSLLAAADIGIASIAAVRQKGFIQSVKLDLQTGKHEASAEEKEVLVPRFQHVVGKVSAEFDYLDESQGTQKTYALAGPLFDILRTGKTLVIDELDRSLHPLLVRRFIEAFHDPDLNQHGAQLIFTTHDTSLLDGELLRRDQIWLTEKREDQSSELLPLATFSPRKGEALEKNYLGGRYGGIPILSNQLITGKIRG
jgi:AAA15 family ATPase/GTPase